jgi:hypothetical protein
VQPLQPDTQVQVTFSNIDHCARLELNGRTVLSMPWPADAAHVRSLGPETAPPQIRIGAAATRLTLRHLVLERDVYYRSPAIQDSRDPETNRVNTMYMATPGWGTADNPIYLRQDECFVLGDNSPQSLDSRLWWHACPLLEPAAPLQQLLAQQRQDLLAGRPVDPGQLGRYLRDLRRTLDTAPAYRLPELEESFTKLTDHVQRDYLPALKTDRDGAVQALANLQRLLPEIDWRYYHLGTVQRDQLIGRAFFVYWPAGLSFLDTPWRCIPNVGQMRLVH